MLMTAEIKWKFEGKKSVICRTWLKMVLSRNDLKAQAKKKKKKIIHSGNHLFQMLPKRVSHSVNLKKEIAEFCVGFLNFNITMKCIKVRSFISIKGILYYSVTPYPNL